MVTYEWCRIGGNRFLAYCNDEANKVKMIAIGGSHNRICHNFAMLLYRTNKYSKLSPSRFIMASEENKELYEKFGHYKRGGIINDNNTIIKTVKEKREEARIEKEEENKVKEQLLEQNKLEESFDKFITKTDEKGNIYIYGIKLVKIYKNKENNNEEDISSNI